MPTDLEFLLGRFEMAYPAFIAWEDFLGPHGDALRLCQQMGFVGPEPGLHPAPSCPHCYEGVPYRIGERILCNRCCNTVALQHLQLWPLDLDAFLRWLASQLQLQGNVRPLDGRFWQLGSGRFHDVRYECFYLRGGALTEAEKNRLSAYRNVLLLCGRRRPADAEGMARSLSLLEVLELREALTVADLSSLLRTRGAVRFDANRGTLSVEDARLGEIPFGCKEFFFIACLAAKIDAFVPYADIKDYVLHHCGSTDSTEEATFCQKLKSRIKKKWVPEIDRLLATSSKADGYRLRAEVDPKLGG